jgi:hypothetical protein
VEVVLAPPGSIAGRPRDGDTAATARPVKPETLPPGADGATQVEAPEGVDEVHVWLRWRDTRDELQDLDTGVAVRPGEPGG